MRATIPALTFVLVALAPTAVGARADKNGEDRVAVDLSGGLDGRGLALAESDKSVYRVHVTARVDKNGEGKGTLVLDRTPRQVDEFGFPQAVAALPPIKLECSLKFVKKKTVQLQAPAPAGAPGAGGAPAGV